MLTLTGLRNLAILGSLLAKPVLSAPHTARQSSLESYLEAQEPISIQGVIDNIGGFGTKVDGASEGVVVASPSKSDPDYFDTWTRDAALTIKALVDRFLVTKDPKLEEVFKAYLKSQTKLQHVENPSGGITNGGLGEPKFHVDLTAFTEGWGRPQRDGPALRATALISYAEYLIAQGDIETVKNSIWPVITSDLQYVAATWSWTGFDLWEEIKGISFFTLVAQHRSLVEGSALAKELGVECINCDQEAPKVRCRMQSLWNNEGYAMADVDNDSGRSGKGTNTILASIHTFDQNASCDDSTFQPCSSKALSNLKVVSDSMRGWPINQGIPQGQAPALGRYVEDVYYNGNPWYLTTTAAAEQLYYAVFQWNKLGSITIDNMSLPFFKDIYASAATGTFKKDSTEFAGLTQGVKALADGYMAVVQKYTPKNGALAEQFSKTDGTPLSARDLTWSYAGFLTAKAARDGKFPPTWGADKAKDLQC